MIRNSTKYFAPFLAAATLALRLQLSFCDGAKLPLAFVWCLFIINHTCKTKLNTGQLRQHGWIMTILPYRAALGFAVETPGDPFRSTRESVLAHTFSDASCGYGVVERYEMFLTGGLTLPVVRMTKTLS